MDNLFDPNSPAMPSELLEMASELRSAAPNMSLGMAESTVSTPSGLVIPALDRWEIRAHNYKKEIAANISFLGGLFGGSGKQVGVGIVHESKRYGVTQTVKGIKVEMGIAVRLSVQTNSSEADAQLTIPNVAAKAQLKSIEARAGISVVGYVGPLGDLLPAPEDFNVETFALFTVAFKAIQARVFGAEGMSYLSPAILAYSQIKP